MCLRLPARTAIQQYTSCTAATQDEPSGVLQVLRESVDLVTLQFEAFRLVRAVSCVHVDGRGDGGQELVRNVEARANEIRSGDVAPTPQVISVILAKGRVKSPEIPPC